MVSRLLLAVVLLAASACGAQQQQQQQQPAFLEASLPLKVAVTTPSEVALGADGGGAVILTGRQAITAVFSRPVIALGSDFGSKQLPAELVPFSLSCKTPGRLRWVTTNIARFDPSVEWPSDLDCAFTWNKGLKAYDGAALQLGDVPGSVRLATAPLVMSVDRVESAAAMAATGGQWSAFLGAPDDRLPEVPPDANVTLAFSYPVELAQLAKALRLAGPGAGSRTVTVSPCVSPVQGPITIFTASGLQASSSKSNGSSSTDLLRLNSTCAVVRILPALDAGAAAVLRLPKGARYSDLAGPVAKDLDIDVFGLRPFRIPLRWDFANASSAQEPLYTGANFRRLSMWLPHGLSKDTSLPALKSAMQLCSLKDPFVDLASPRAGAISPSTCVDQDFQISRPAPGLLLMRVPALQPRQRYVLRVRDDAKVKDAFGLPLQQSSDAWWAVDLESAFAGPSVQRVALLEPAANAPALQWPWVARGYSRDPQGDPLKQVQAWSIPVPGSGSGSASASGGGSSSQLERALASITSGFGGAATGVLGTTTGATLNRPSASWPTFQALALPGQPGVSFLGACCNTVNWPTTRQVLDRGAMVVQSDLQAAFVEQRGHLLAWVTTTRGRSAPVAGARVQVYSTAYNSESAAPGPSCTTAADGTCSLDLSTAAATTTKQQQGTKQVPSFTPETAFRSAVVTADGHGPLIVPDLPFSGRRGGSRPEYVATLVLDRQLVKPGDDLHVTGYIQQQAGAELKAPTDLKQVILQVSPGFSAGGGRDSSSRRSSTPLRVRADVSAVGSVHAVIPVPKDASPAAYSLQLWTEAEAGSSSSSNVMPKAAGPSAAANALPSKPNIAAAPRTEPMVAALASPADAAAGSGDTPAPGRLPQPVALSRPGSGGSSERRRLQQQPTAEPRVAAIALAEPAVAVDAALPAEVTEEATDAPPVQPDEPEQQPATAGAAATPPDASFTNPPQPARAVQLMPLGQSLASVQFTVGDPRPPTASLSLTTGSAWVRPDGSVTAVMAAKSYVGSDLAGAEVTLKWSTAKAQGELRLATNASGVASGKVELGALPTANRSEAGDSLSLRATWVGPTREPLMQSKTIKIADGPVRVELARTLATHLPGVAFGVRADAFSNEDDSPVKGATVEVSLVPRNGSASLAACSEAQRAAVGQQRCSVTSGDAAAASTCQLQLPCPGEFLLKGCITSNSSSSRNSNSSSGGGGCSMPLRLGRNATTWAAAPWSSGPGQLSLLADRRNVTEGSNVSLTVQNPYWGPTSGLLVWGNGELREQRVLPEVPPGVVAIRMVDLGPECRAGCKVVLTLAVARPEGSSPLTQPPPPPSTAQRPSPAAASAATNGSSGSGGGGAANGQQQRQRQRQPPGATAPLGADTAAAIAVPAPANEPIEVRRYNVGPLDVHVNAPSSLTRAHNSGWGSWLLPSSWRGGGGNSARRNERGVNGATATTATSASGGSSKAPSALPDVPRSLLYDPLAPVSVSVEVELAAQADKGVAVTVSVSGQSKDAAGTAVVAPQSRQGSIDVTVKDASGAAVGGAEVTLVVVDRALLDLMPYPLQDVSRAMQARQAAYFTVAHLNSLRVGRPAINATFAALQRRLLSMDPYLPIDTQVTPSPEVWRADFAGGRDDDAWLPRPAVAAVDIPDDKYLAGFTTPLTPLPARVCTWTDPTCPVAPYAEASVTAMSAMAMAAPMAMPVAAVAKPGPMAAANGMMVGMAQKSMAAADSPLGRMSGGGAPAPPPPSAAAAGSSSLRLQQDFQVTVLFRTVTTGADGTVSWPLPAPDNLGRFAVRAYVVAPRAATAASGSSSSAAAPLQYGAAESEVVVRRTVSLVPALPRQVRTGDNFTAGVLVEAPGTMGDVTVTVTAALQHAGTGGSSASGTAKVLRMSGAKTATVQLSPSKPQQEVRFSFHADSIGSQNITFAATAGGGDRGAAAAAAEDAAASGLRRHLRRLMQLLPGAARSPAAAAGTAAAEGAVADQVQLQVPVLGKQGPVWVATSFALRASEGNSSSSKGSWQEGLVLPSAERGSGSIELVAGVGSLPAIQATYSGLADQGLEGPTGCTSGSQAVALSVLPALLALYRPPDTPVTALLNSSAVALTTAAATTAAGKLTHSKFGLLAQDPGCVSAFAIDSAPVRADITLNAWAVHLVRQSLSSSSGSSGGGGNSTSNSTSSGRQQAGTLAAAWGSLQTATRAWTAALQEQLVADAVAARRGGRGQAPAPYADLEAVSWARLVLGPAWEPSVKVPAAANNGANQQDQGGDSAALAEAVRKDLSMQRLSKAAVAGNLTVGGQARVGLTLLQDPKTRASVASSNGNSGSNSKRSGGGGNSEAAAAVNALVKWLSGSIRVGGRTAYVASGSGQRGAAGLSDQALALTLLVESNADDANPLVQKLAAWVAQGAALPPLVYAALSASSSAWESGLRAQALTVYDSSASSITPDVQLTVAAATRGTNPAGGSTNSTGSSKKGNSDKMPSATRLLSAAFTPANAGRAVSSSTPWAAVPANASLAFLAAGSGEVSVAASLNFTPSELLPFPTYRGLWVQSAVLLDSRADTTTNSSRSGSSNAPAAAEAGIGLGQIVTLVAQVTTADDQADVLVEVLMPGGLEPLDPNVFRDPEAASTCSSSDDEGGGLDAGGGGGFVGRLPANMAAPPMMVKTVAAAAPGRGFSGSSSGGRSVWPGRSIWPMCPLQTTTPQGVAFRYAYLRAGTHTMRFRAVAATSGAFVLPPVKAYVQAQPEVMGLSPAGQLVVCAKAAGGCAAKAPGTGGGAASPAAAKACPANCNGNGACNLARGLCICNAGFSGPGCGVFGGSPS